MSNQQPASDPVSKPVHRAGLLHMRELAETLVFTTPDGESVSWHKGADQIDRISLVLDCDARIVYCSNHFLRLTGWQRAAVLDRDWFELFIPAVAPGMIEVFSSLLENAPLAGSHENAVLTRCGERRWIRWHNTILQTPSGKVIGIASSGEDLTDRRRTLENHARVEAIGQVSDDAITANDSNGSISERDRDGAQLRESEWRFRQLAENIREVLFLHDAASDRTLYVSPGYERVWGRSCASARALPNAWMEGVHPEDRAAVLANREKGTETGQFEDEFRVVRPDGEIRWVRARGFLIRDGVDGGSRIGGVCEDITAQKEQQQKLARLSRLYAVLSGINSAIVRIRDRKQLLDEACRIAVAAGEFRMAWIAALDPGSSDGTVIASHGASAEYLQTVKFTAREGLPHSVFPGNRALREMRPVVCNSIAADPVLKSFNRVWLDRDVRSGAAFPLIVEGRVIAVMSLFSSEVDGFDAQEILMLSELAGDIAFGLQYIDKEERLRFLAYHDVLTGLANSALFNDQLTQCLQSAQEQQSIVSVILLDLDRFTHINDTLGRHVGDVLLKTVAVRLKEALPQPHLVARISADTFALAICHPMHGADAASSAMEQIFASLAKPMLTENKELQLAAKAGVASYPADGQDAATVFKNADVALRRAQTSGQQCVLYAPAMNAETAQKLSLERRLRKALELEQFVLHYQPKVSTKNGCVVGLEALIRWNDPESGLVPPAQFIGALEETGLILDVGRWAIGQALRDHRRWSAGGLQPPRIAVNVSAVQLRRSGFVDVVRNAIESSDVTSEALELEITESVIIEDVETNIRALQEIRDLGVTIAIDDFGTGYSSLRYLAKLPVDCLKIDRSFIATMVSDPDSMTIVSTVISLAHALGLYVVAEGVETEEQSKLLKLMRCDEMQGFLFYKPLPGLACETLLRSNSAMLMTGAFRRHRTS